MKSVEHFADEVIPPALSLSSPHMKPLQATSLLEVGVKKAQITHDVKQLAHEPKIIPIIKIIIIN